MNIDRQEILLNQETNKFRNVKEKIRNKQLSHETAWEVAQPLLSTCVEDYPEKYNPHLSLIKAIFSFRREAYLRRIEDQEASKEIKKLFSSLQESDQDKIGELASCIRDFFDTSDLWRRRGKSHR